MKSNTIGRVLTSIGSMLGGGRRRTTHARPTTTTTRRRSTGLGGILRRVFG